MLKGGFIEAETQVAKLPEDDVTAFELLIEWVYTGKATPINLPEEREQGLIKLYGLSEKYCLHDLSDYTMTLIVSNYRRVPTTPSYNAIALAYSCTHSASLLRKFMIRAMYFIVTADDDWEILDIANLVKNGDIAYDLLTFLKHEPWETDDPVLLYPCVFHKHDKDGACPYTGDM